MNIGFDAKRYFLNATGLGNYSRNTIRLLSRYFPNHHYFLYTPRTSTRFGLSAFGNNTHVRLPATAVTRFLHPLWRTFLLGNQTSQDALDIFHGLSHEIPYGIPPRTKTVVTIHDLIFLRHPELYNRLDVAIYRAKYRSSCKRADRIIAISEQTKQDITTFFSIDPKKIEVVYQSCDTAFYSPVSSRDKQAIRAKYHLPKEFILYVGSLAERKNVHILIEALAKIHSNNRLPLVLVGQGQKRYLAKIQKIIEQRSLTKDVLFLQTIPSQDLPTIYQLARLFVYPSKYEGFGIPILEALFSKTPAITSTGSCFREVGGSATIYTPPGDSEAMAAAMENVLGDQELSTRMRARGYEHAQKFHEGQVATNLMAVYNKLRQHS